MRLQSKPSRMVCAAVLCAWLSAPGAARAQLDDPGLAPPPPPPSSRPAPPPPPAPTPAPVRSPSPAPAARPPATPPPARDSPPAAALTPPAPEVKEEVKEETKLLGSAGDDRTWEQNLAAPSSNGAIGLLRMMTAENGAPATFRTSLHVSGFTADNFLIDKDKKTGANGDSNSRFLGDFLLSLQGPDLTVLRNLELYFALFNSSNQNKRNDSNRTDPAVILSLADVGLGLKGAGEVTRGFSIGANFGVRFLNSVSGVAANLDATVLDFNLIAMLDVRRLAPTVPLRLHLNLGYIVDNSLQLLPTTTDAQGVKHPQCYLSMGNDPCVRSRLVETFAYGINTSRFRLAVAVELPFVRHQRGGGIVGVSPFVEYHLEVATSDGDTLMRDKLFLQADSDLKNCATDPDPAGCRQGNLDFRNRINNQVSQFLTIGLRLRPVVRLVIDLGVDVRLQNPGWQYGPALPPWNIHGGLGYTYDLIGGQSRQVTRTITRTVPVNKKPPEGKLLVTVTDVDTRKPIVGALVRYPQGSGLTPQATDEKGQFLSYGLPAGPIKLEVSHPDYKPESGSPRVKIDEVRSIPLSLKALPPKEGKVRVKVIDEKGGALPGATGRFVCAAGVTREGLFDGEVLVAMLPPGTCSASIDANGFLGKDRQVTVAANGDQLIEVQLAKRPKTPHVELTRDAIVVKTSVHFATNEAVILPDGQQLLNEVVDLISRNPQIKRLSIEGHTDNSGDPQKNLQLSKDRARAVLEYLVKNGIAPERLSSEGYGQEKPLSPNSTAGGRAKNRRVEFRILDQANAPLIMQ